jgi:hypothetical protein
MNRHSFLMALAVFLSFGFFPADAAEDSPITTLDRTLTPIIRKTFPDAKIEVTATTYQAKHGTMDFTVHRRNMAGEIFPQTDVLEGPSYKGFFLHIGLHDGLYDGQAVMPQDLQEPYWTTFLDAPALPGKKQYFLVNFSYGSRLDKDFKQAMMEVLPKSIIASKR